MNQLQFLSQSDLDLEVSAGEELLGTDAKIGDLARLDKVDVFVLALVEVFKDDVVGVAGRVHQAGGHCEVTARLCQSAYSQVK